MKSFLFVTSFSLAVLLISNVSAWGNLGHRTVALLANKYFTADGHTYALTLLQGEEISEASIWADKYKFTPGGWNTGSWHFVDALDDPPKLCNVEFKRDCNPNRICILAATANMISQLEDVNLPIADRTMAFKFLIHLIADLHMPLHVESIAKGGNDIKVLFDGHPTNLHFVWDVSIPQKLTGSTEANEFEAANLWALKLFHLPSTSMRQEFHGIEKASLEDPNMVILEWAKEANSWVCKYVLANGTDQVQGSELSGDYYEGSIPIVEDLVEKAGIRLGGLVNLLALRLEQQVFRSPIDSL